VTLHRKDDSQKSIFVTGTTSGIGKAIVQCFAEAKWKVFAGVRDTASAKALGEFGFSGVEPVVLDVTRKEQIQAAAARLTEELGDRGLDGLINNAGVCEPSPVECASLEGFRSTLEVNLVGVVATTQSFLPLLRKATGRIVSIGTVTREPHTVPLFGTYAASKSALISIMRSLRCELRPSGIKVCIVDPGFIHTPLWDKNNDRLNAVGSLLSGDDRAHYEKCVANMGELLISARRMARSPRLVATATYRAMTSRKPKFDYTVGVDTKMALFASRFLPNSVVDMVLGHLLGL
jgi:NAD(P)-dependent dehydrogenase (short-subunit alcohol dehydrogenase family)